MYKIDRDANRINALENPSFSELGFRERDHIQEWIANRPSVLGEDLLIIQKEFSGFSDTNERLDLLALDKYGSLVLIENKLDDAGRDVTWQALKYASYCSRLSRDQIVQIYQEFLDRSGLQADATAMICQFLDRDDISDFSLNQGITQRIILVAAKFRKEVTSTVLWLMNFKIKIQCFKTTPYRLENDLYISFEQIIPTRDAEEFMIGLAQKALNEVGEAEADKGRHGVRREFWAALLSKVKLTSTRFASVGPAKASWISASSGLRGISLNFVATASECRVELYIDRGDKSINELIFSDLYNRKSFIEEKFGLPLIWQRLNERRACRIKFETEANVFDRSRWSEMIVIMNDAMDRFEKALAEPLKELADKLKAGCYASNEGLQVAIIEEDEV